MTITDKLIEKFSKEDVFKKIIGQNQVKFQLKSALCMGRSIILVGPPGCGKTTFAKSLSEALPGEAPFVRVQGSPDLTAEDLLGDIDPIKALEFGPTSKEAFVPGKIFKANQGVLFFDEINRCPQKIQNALLQVLQEKYATIGSYDVDFPSDFIFIGTMNPEDSSTEKLSHVFMDRFDFIYVDYPDKIEEELQIIKENSKEFIEFPEDILFNTVLFVRSLRENEKLSRHPSVRATLGLYERAQSNAFLQGKKKVDAFDVSNAILSVLSHRIELKPSFKYLQKTENFVKEEFKKFAKSKGIEIESSETELG